jgi:glycosyltransferase involved in cell wall biosynthesis/predicted SAM-dependent methyltransferase
MVEAMRNNAQSLSIVHINTHDNAGGAAKVAWRLAKAQRNAGHNSRMVVGIKSSDTEHSSPFPIEHDPARQSYCKDNGQLFYDCQGSHKLIANPIVKSADILHLHNLHGGYFNPFSISALSHLKPVVWTLHDMQAITGHCAHSFDCQRWQTGCGRCPYLNIEPSIQSDTSAQLLRDKKLIYDHSRLWLVTPSQWLKSKIGKSILQNHPVELIYNSINTTVFRPYDKAEARMKFGIPAKALVVGAVAHGGALTNQWKGGKYTQEALDALKNILPDYVFVNMGGDYKTDDPRIINIPHIDNESELARAYSTLDVFLNTSIADNCPLVILEALSCGIPIVSFTTGGIPELVRNGMDGYVTEYKNIPQIVEAVERLAIHPQLLAEFGHNARERATSKFDIQIISKQYENLYQQVLEESKARKKETKLFPMAKIPKVVMTKTFEEAENCKVDILRLERQFTQSHGSSQTEYDVSIVLCTKNRAPLLDQMLASLKDAVKGVNCEIIVIEGNSSDNTQNVLHKHGITKVYNEAESLGTGKHSWPELYNFGFSKAHGKWAMYASDDIVFRQECITKALNSLNKQKDEVAGGIFFYKNIHSDPGWDTFGIDFTYGPKLLMNYGLVRLDYFRQVGGLDKAYRFYGADGDLCFKLYESGKQFIPLPGCFIVHNNILDMQKQTNMDNSRRDFDLYMKRWKHFVSMEMPKPKRLLWQEDSVEAFNLPFNLEKIDQGIEYFWNGLACLQQGLFEQAKFGFFMVIKSSSCDHWCVLWYLAKAAYECGDKPLAEKAAGAVIKLAPNFIEAKDFIKQLGCKPEQYTNQRIGHITNNKVKTIDYNNDTLKQIKEFGLWNEGTSLRLHLGCGQNHFDGYINIDYPPSEHIVQISHVADVFGDITKLDFPQQSVDEIRLHHVFEHLNRIVALAMLIKWHKWLKVGGILHIETPDLMGSARTLISNASWKTKMGVVRHLTGDQVADWGYHVNFWFSERFEHTLRALGFEPIQTQSTSWPKEPYLSNVEVVAVKNKDNSLQQQLIAAEKLLYESTVAPEEKPTWEAWRNQLHTIFKRDFISPPSNTYTLDVSSISQVPDVLSMNASQLPLDEIHGFNKRTRDRWVISKARTIPAGTRVLDIGAGTCPYRPLFVHCDYKTHDFKKYKGIKQNNTTEYGKIDYESDITSIPVPDQSFDVILCTEVLEHVPEPIEALREMSRIIRKGGRLLITAPLGSGLHQTPYHYYGGYTPQWYQHFLPKFGLQVKEISPNGGFFKLLAQECTRLVWTLPQHKHLHGNNVELILQLFGEWLPRYLYALDENCFIDQFTVGYHIEAEKLPVSVLHKEDLYQPVSRNIYG